MDVKPWYVRHIRLAWTIVICCAVAGSTAGVLTADALYHTSLRLWTASLVQAGLSLGGSLLGAATGVAIVLSIGGRRER
jgi:predicted membrane protein